MVVLHYTGMESGAAALARLCDGEAKVSAHYLIERSGRIYQLVEEQDRAWHAGRSHWQGVDGVNDRSIGIELVNRGHWFGYEDFPEAQIIALVQLLNDLRKRHKILPTHIVGHSDVAPDRKEDPGEKFPWGRLAQQGLALAPFAGEPAPAASLPDYEQSLQLLQEIGYGIRGPHHGAALLAFQRHFCPQSLGQGFDPLTRTALQHLARQTREILTKA